MNIYFVNYQPGYLLGNRQYFEQNAVYIFNSKYGTTRSVYVKTDKSTKEFSLNLKIAYERGFIAQYNFSKEIDEKGISKGCFNKNEVDNLSILKTNAKIKNINKYFDKSNLKDNNTLLNLEAELKDIVGLEEVKNDLKDLCSLIEVSKERKKRGLINDSISLHAVFRGAPGTGKTTMARKLGKLYKNLGILKKGHTVEVDRGDFTGQYIGHTEENTKKILNKALDGVLFIDEVYSLKSNENSNDYGHIAVELILKFMEDNRDRIAVVIAGYNGKMDSFLATNEGLRSRFTNFYNFKNYSESELSMIFDIMMKDGSYEYSPKVKTKVKKLFQNLIKKNDPEYFGNAREVRNVCGVLKKIQHKRIFSNKDFKNKDNNFFVKINLNDIKQLYNKYDISTNDQRTVK